jgi:hypothetical protein
MATADEWDTMGKTIPRIKRKYRGRDWFFARDVVINPAIAAYEAGDRSECLYAQLVELRNLRVSARESPVC